MSHAVADVIAPTPDVSPPPRRRWPRRVLLGAVVVILLLGAAALAVRAYDQAHAQDLLPGVHVAGLDVGGMDAAAVVDQLEGQVPDRGARRILLKADETEVEATLAQLGLRSDAAAAVARAEARAESMGVLSRVWHRLLDEPVDASYPVRYTVDRARVASAVAGLASQVDRDPVDAKIDTSTDVVTIVPAVPGRGLDRAATTRQLLLAADVLANAETEGSTPRIDAPVRARAPQVAGFDDVLLVRLAENKLYHYENGGLAKTYTVATGTARYPTPKGQFQITQLRRNPTWVNPDPDGWGRSLPARIGPGPRNPLGTRAMNLSAPGIRIHGTRNVGSLGTAASHGCIRMSIAESEELFEKVAVGTPVVIITGPPPAAPPPASEAPSSTFADPNAPVDLEAG